MTLPDKKLHRRKWLRILVLIYLALLIASHIKRAIDPVETETAGDQQVFLAEGYGEDSGETLRITYLDKGPTDGTSLLLIHGSPVGTAVFAELIEEIPENYRIIAPDLPGHGHSTHQVTDGSFRADADYLHQLLNFLQIPSINVLAYSRGGGPALRLLDEHPAEVRSLILLSSIGVQEQELLGNYTLNHALHSLQFGFFFLLEELIPHFGYLDNAILNTDYARSFSDADQRPLREILSRVEVPTLILHGKDDPLVPLSAAEEHHRIVPQSEKIILPDGHLMLIRKADELSGHISSFIDRSEKGLAKVKAQASPTRLLQAAEAKAESPGAPASGRGLLFLAVILVLATFASEDLTCIVAGILAAAGTISFPVALAACFVGIFIGDLAIFFAGRIFGPKAVRHAPLRFVMTPQRLEFAEGWFKRRGAVLIITSRFIPGSRLPIYLAAGMAKADTLKFIIYFFIATALWTPLLVGLAMVLGDPILRLFAQFEHWALPGLIGLILFIIFLLKVVIPLFTHRGRRIAYAKWKRKVRWEFWPRWVFYPPVVLWIIWLGLRYRQPALFTAANPGMEGGGIAFESKTAILSLLQKGNGRTARFLPLSPGKTVERWIEEIEAFQKNLAAPYPIVSKPDFGERGDGVRIIHNSAELREALEEADRQPIIQEFIAGPEFGVFFEKAHSEKTGVITSITRKIHTTVEGDGKRTLDELILDDSWAVFSYPYFREKYRDRLLTVPAKEESIELATLGSHCRGSLFLDGADLLTPELSASIQKIFEGVDGLCFGRMDVKCPSEDHFRRGEEITVLEFNGLTSEPTHIYDPKTSLWTAYRTLFAQWKRAFEVARKNQEAGFTPWAPKPTLRLLVRALRGQPPAKIDPEPPRGK